MRWYLLTLAFYLLTFYALNWGYSNKYQFNHPSKRIYKNFGLDLSRHQGEIDWKNVEASKISFNYIKASEGTDYLDEKFAFNFENSLAKGIKTGAYHFWIFCKSKEEQVTHIINHLPKQEGLLIPAIDMESLKACEGFSPQQGADKIREDLEYINTSLKAHYGKLPLIYTTQEFAHAYPEILKAPNPYWLRSLVGPPKYKKEWKLWQYYNKGSMKGFKGDVDLNALNPRFKIESLLQ